MSLRAARGCSFVTDDRRIRCAKDMSDIGARLAIGVPGLAPAEFVLQFSPDGSVGRRCEVRWQRGGDIGVKFTARLVNSRRVRSSLGILDC